MEREAWGPGLSHLRLGLGVVGRPGAHGASRFHQEEAERGAKAAQPRGAVAGWRQVWTVRQAPQVGAHKLKGGGNQGLSVV